MKKMFYRCLSQFHNTHTIFRQEFLGEDIVLPANYLFKFVQK